ncbi:MAG: GAF domain-containing protein [Ignavibacteria bacterium]|jgi:GAF domain-containing protein|nr:GAF domain-containing protein [Ignavibacteria bacterium]MCU7502376.1 GAF domain-containing protein [Ignavibacteria bacterium]MCU7515059.1 GAF domain-containing protein [Ignavibacteria bacterium]
MSETIEINDKFTDEEKYRELIPQMETLLSEDDFTVTTLSNFAAALKQTFSKVSWAGFYLKKGDYLYLGPFQGKVACTRIKIGQGVCGTSAFKKVTLIVPDVDKFPGHIACDSFSRSEIVVPLVKNDELYGVLDLDSTSYSSFNETDKKYLERLGQLVLEKIDCARSVI